MSEHNSQQDQKSQSGKSQNPFNDLNDNSKQKSQKSFPKNSYVQNNSQVHDYHQIIQQQDEIDNLFGNENDHDPDQLDMIKQYNIIKKERNNVENNQKLLENRINLLKQEELRTLKKIEETRKKALEIYYLKKKNEEKQKKRDQEKEQIQKKNLFQEEQRKQQQQEHKMMIDRKKIMKRDAAEKIKRISEVYQVTIEKKKQDTQKKQSLNRVEILKTKDQAKKKEEDRIKQKKLVITNEIRKNIEYESKIKVWKEREIEQLENFEMDLIQRLQNTQQMQKTAFDELESALTMPAQEFAEKYLKPKNQVSQQVITDEKQNDSIMSGQNQNQSDNELSKVSHRNKGMNQVRSQPQLEASIMKDEPQNEQEKSNQTKVEPSKQEVSNEEVQNQEQKKIEKQQNQEQNDQGQEVNEQEEQKKDSETQI